MDNRCYRLIDFDILGYEDVIELEMAGSSGAVLFGYGDYYIS